MPRHLIWLFLIVACVPGVAAAAPSVTLDSAWHPAMIDEATFAQVVRRTVVEALSPYGYVPTTDVDFRVRFEKPTSYLEVIYDATQSHGAPIWLSESPGDHEPPLELASVLRATDRSTEAIRFAALIQTSHADALGRPLELAARLLRECTERLLGDGPKAFATARTLRSGRAAA